MHLALIGNVHRKGRSFPPEKESAYFCSLNGCWDHLGLLENDYLPLFFAFLGENT